MVMAMLLILYDCVLFEVLALDLAYILCYVVVVCVSV